MDNITFEVFMANGYSVDDLLAFLAHAGDKGLLPQATAGALGVATRNVLGVLEGPDREDIRGLKLDSVIKRFTNKRAQDFSPSSLKEYARRVNRAVELFLSWRGDPANFTVKTRATSAGRKKDRPSRPENVIDAGARDTASATSPHGADGYESSFPVRPGTIVTVLNIPSDLTPGEADRLAKFVRMLAVE